MSRLDADELERVTRDIFAAWGASQHDAAWVATPFVRATLRGHDSPGAIRVPRYIRALRAGEVNPTPKVRIVAETASIALIDGDRGFAQVVAKGEPEERTQRERRAGGGPLDEETWRQCAAEVGVRA